MRINPYVENVAHFTGIFIGGWIIGYFSGVAVAYMAGFIALFIVGILLVYFVTHMPSGPPEPMKRYEHKIEEYQMQKDMQEFFAREARRP